jgi:hypothetical protein
VRDDNDEHPEKQLTPRELTEFGIVRDENDVQFLKHLFPMETIDFGSFKFLRLRQFSKQLSGREQISSGNSNVSIEQFKIFSSPCVILKFSDIDQMISILISVLNNHLSRSLFAEFNIAFIITTKVPALHKVTT